MDKRERSELHHQKTKDSDPKGMPQVARNAGLSRESLYKALCGERSLGFDTILKVIGALGLKLHAEVSHG